MPRFARLALQYGQADQKVAQNPLSRENWVGRETENIRGSVLFTVLGVEFLHPRSTQDLDFDRPEQSPPLTSFRFQTPRFQGLRRNPARPEPPKLRKRRHDFQNLGDAPLGAVIPKLERTFLRGCWLLFPHPFLKLTMIGD